MAPKLRSRERFGGDGKGVFIHRIWMKNRDFVPEMFDGRTVTGICNTWSERALVTGAAQLRTAEHRGL